MIDSVYMCSIKVALHCSAHSAAIAADAASSSSYVLLLYHIERVTLRDFCCYSWLVRASGNKMMATLPLAPADWRQPPGEERGRERGRESRRPRQATTPPTE